jgi:hypothetical protein
MMRFFVALPFLAAFAVGCKSDSGEGDGVVNPTSLAKCDLEAILNERSSSPCVSDIGDIKGQKDQNLDKILNHQVWVKVPKAVTPSSEVKNVLLHEKLGYVWLEGDVTQALSLLGERKGRNRPSLKVVFYTGNPDMITKLNQAVKAAGIETLKLETQEKDKPSCCDGHHDGAHHHH